MSKKKSVVLITLISIVLVVFLIVAAIPSFPLAGTVKVWNPAIRQMDTDAELGGGYYAYYYPVGVKSALDYDSEKDGDKYIAHGGIYLSTDEKHNIFVFDDEGCIVWEEDKPVISDSFKEDFEASAAAIKDRFARVGYSSFKVSVVDDYALYVEIPNSDSAYANNLQTLSYLGDVTITDGTTDLLKDYIATNKIKDKTDISDYIKGFSTEIAATGNPVINIRFTGAGSTMIRSVTETLAANSSSSSSGSGASLSFKVGDNTVWSVSVSEALSPIEGKLSYTGSGYSYLTAIATTLNSALKTGDTGITFQSVQDVRAFDAKAGEDALTKVYIAVLTVLVVGIVLSFVFLHGYGAPVTYSLLTYVFVSTILFAFVTEQVLELSLGTVLVFLLGAVVIAATGASNYFQVKKEAASGKTIESCAKAAHKKTFLMTLDVCVCFVIVALCLLIGVAGWKYLAIQAIVCSLAAAFCSLLWTRVLNVLFMSANKDKYKYFGFARRDDDDE